MKRRDFVKNIALTALGVGLIHPLETFASTGETYLESEDLSPALKSDEDFPLNFIAVGDWGRSGESHQLEVAQQMGEWANNNPNNFVISVGDNFYPRGVVSEQDPLWHYSFENIYTAHSLQCDWYPILGNHDYGSDPDAQIRYSKVSRRWNMPARYYTKEVKLGRSDDKVLFVFIDTNPFARDEVAETEKQVAWIDQTLAQASAQVKWKIVVGHHPYYTVGPRIKNYDTLAVRRILAKTLEKHKVDIYLSGHDHSLQHLKPEGFTHQFISGAGSELTPVQSGVPYSKFEAAEHGFMYFSLNKNRIRAKAIDDTGKVLYETELKR